MDNRNIFHGKGGVYAVHSKDVQHEMWPEGKLSLELSDTLHSWLILKVIPPQYAGSQKSNLQEHVVPNH